MTWRSEETISNQTLNDIFAVASTHCGDPRQALHSIAIMAADQANEEHMGYLAYLRRPQMIVTGPDGVKIDLDGIKNEYERKYAGPQESITERMLSRTLVAIGVAVFGAVVVVAIAGWWLNG